MEYFAFLFGLLVGIYFLTNGSTYGQLAAYILFYRFRDKKRFYVYYNRFKKPEALEMLDDQGVVKNFKDYLKILKKYRSSAYENAMDMYGYYASRVIFRQIPFCIFTSIIFLSNWYCYIAGILFIAILRTVYYLIFYRWQFAYYINAFYIYSINQFFIEIRWPKESDRP